MHTAFVDYMDKFEGQSNSKRDINKHVNSKELIWQDMIWQDMIYDYEVLTPFNDILHVFILLFKSKLWTLAILLKLWRIYL